MNVLLVLGTFAAYCSPWAFLADIVAIVAIAIVQVCDLPVQPLLTVILSWLVINLLTRTVHQFNFIDNSQCTVSISSEDQIDVNQSNENLREKVSMSSLSMQPTEDQPDSELPLQNMDVPIHTSEYGEM